MKIFILLVMVAFIIYIGVGIRAYYKKRSQVLADILQFCNIFENELRFNRGTLSDIVRNNLYLFDKDFAEVLEEFFINNKDIGSRYLTKTEESLMYKFFKSLGKSDENGEVRNLNNYRAELLQLKEKGTEEYSKYGGFAVKISVVIGALLFIILI